MFDLQEAAALLRSCRLCPRSCGVDRLAGERGVCGCGATVRVARAALHFWEEPCLSGEHGSGAVFFSGCSLHCCFCQNHQISTGLAGRDITTERLCGIFSELEAAGAENINLVTAGHYLPLVVFALQQARAKGMRLPVVYNSGGYERVETLRLLEGLVDIYLPDLKFHRAALSSRYAAAPDYFRVAAAAIAEMVRQVGKPQFDARGMLRRGVIVRHLALPGQGEDSQRILRYLAQRYDDAVYLSLMSQYTPLPHAAAYPELQRRLTAEEYSGLVDYAAELGIVNAYIQGEGAADAEFIPPFDNRGV